MDFFKICYNLLNVFQCFIQKILYYAITFGFLRFGHNVKKKIKNTTDFSKFHFNLVVGFKAVFILRLLDDGELSSLKSQTHPLKF